VLDEEAVPKIYWEPSDPPSQAGYDFVQVGEPLNGIGEGLLIDLGVPGRGYGRGWRGRWWRQRRDSWRNSNAGEMWRSVTGRFRPDSLVLGVPMSLGLERGAPA
jgi:hypothetical protein